MKACYLAVTIMFLYAGGTFAGTQDQATVVFHAQAFATKAIVVCSNGTPNAQGLACPDFNAQWPTQAGADVYLVVASAAFDPGIAGLSCGIEFDSTVGMFGWSLCADLDFPNGGWPASGGGNRITWVASTNCQRYTPEPFVPYTVQAVAGAFYVYAYGDGVLRITPNNGVAIPELKVADCDASESDVGPFSVSWVGFGTEPGYNACFPCKPNAPGCTPVERSTWGQIKAGFK